LYSRFEEKLKRTCFNVNALDQKQLRVWDQYLDWQVEQGDHQRIVAVFERCLITCALYEQFWAKYARYLERAHKEGKDRDDIGRTAQDIGEVDIGKARDIFKTGLGCVEQLREARCTWTLRGWRETLEDGTHNMKAEGVGDVDEVIKDGDLTKSLENLENSSMESEEGRREALTSAVMSIDETYTTENCADTEDGKKVLNENVEANVVEDGEVDNLGSLKPGDGYSSQAVEAEMPGVVASDVWQVQGRGWEAVRDVYRRAAIVHCPRKAEIRMKWAQFEENIVNVEKARKILKQLVAKHPMLLEARMQQIELESREKNWVVAEKIYTKLMKQILSKNEKYKNMKTWIAMKYARFQFKICGNADKALAALRSALEKERGNARLYSQIIDICYQRQPIDVTGVTAAIELALVSKELSRMAKFELVQRKVEFMQEFGDVGHYRDVWDQLKKLRHLCNADLTVEARRKAELEEEEKRLQSVEEMQAQSKEVAPTWDLNIERYDYGVKRKAYDADYEYVESSRNREYERLEGEGYDVTVKDQDAIRKNNYKANEIGHNPEKFTPGHTTSDYIIPPKVLQDSMATPLPMVKKPPGQLELEEHEHQAFDLPLADPSVSPSVNVLLSFAREGGELCLSESPNGMSVICYVINKMDVNTKQLPKTCQRYTVVLDEGSTGRVAVGKTSPTTSLDRKLKVSEIRCMRKSERSKHSSCSSRSIIGTTLSKSNLIHSTNQLQKVQCSMCKSFIN
jgi:tetratricopeptide (TPR) repeat protein